MQVIGLRCYALAVFENCFLKLLELVSQWIIRKLTMPRLIQEYVGIKTIILSLFMQPLRHASSGVSRRDYLQ